MTVLAALNDAQCEAAQVVNGPILILAGAGSGKTRVLTHRIAFLIDEIGVQAATENEQQILFNVINGRNEQMRPVILISNLDAEGIKKVLGERSSDRIRECCRVVQFNWQSWRGKA